LAKGHAAALPAFPPVAFPSSVSLPLGAASPTGAPVAVRTPESPLARKSF
jgi:hypothetical protein